MLALDERTRPALSGNHDGHSAHALQRCLAHSVRVCATWRMCVGGARSRRGCGGRSSLQRTVAARHNRRRIGGHHQSFRSRQSVSAVCVGSAPSSCGPPCCCEALPVIPRIGVAVVVAFGIVPVAAVVGVSGSECVVLRG